jgi:hypothetical protein
MLNIDSSHIASAKELESRFSFISNEILRTNVAIAFQYIIFLIPLTQEQTEIPGPIRYSLYKNIILYTASIVEACLHYCIWKLIESKKVGSEILPHEWVNTTRVGMHQTSERERVVGMVQRKSQEKLKSSMQFQSLNRAAKQVKLFSEEIYKKADWLRTKRNDIHLVGLSGGEEMYLNQADTEKAFQYARDILKVIETECLK